MPAPKPRTYARAIYEAALQENLSTLREMDRALQRDGLAARLDGPTVPFEEKQKALDAVLPKDADPQVRNLLYTLASRNDLSLLNDVLDDYEGLLRAGVIEIPLALVKSAVALSEEQRQDIERRVRERFGQDLDVRFEVDPSIVGGLVVRVGDRILDGSVQGKLAALRQRLKQGF